MLQTQIFDKIMLYTVMSSHIQNHIGKEYSHGEWSLGPIFVLVDYWRLTD